MADSIGTDMTLENLVFIDSLFIDYLYSKHKLKE